MSRRVLFVDDEPMLLGALQRMLRPMRGEWEMHFAPGGAEALALMAARPFDVIVTDMRMPGMDGAELLAEVCRRYPLTMRVVLTGQCSAETMMRLASTAHRVLHKPCGPETIKTTIQRTCSLQELLRSEQLAALTGRLPTVPSPPALYVAIVEELKQPEPSLEKIAVLMAQDIGMAAKLLQLANSALLGLRWPVPTVSQAVLVLGLETTKALVLAAGVFARYDPAALAPFSINNLWQHSQEVGALARRIAAEEGAEREVALDAAFGGLLHDIGRLVLAAQLPEAYKKVLELVERDGLAVTEAEAHVFGATHAEVGAYLLGLWGLPEALVEAVAWHHRPSQCPGRDFTVLTAVHAADTALPGGDGVPDVEYLERLGLRDRMPVWAEHAASVRNGD